MRVVHEHEVVGGFCRGCRRRERDVLHFAYNVKRDTLGV